jgi:mercuric ion binding protein
MRLLKAFVVVAAVCLAPMTALAVEKTVTLKIDGMTCAGCPYQVQRALKGVSGVTSVKASLADREAVVVFDDAKTTIAALTKATTEAGFPSTLKPEDGGTKQ